MFIQLHNGKEWYLEKVKPIHKEKQYGMNISYYERRNVNGIWAVFSHEASTGVSLNGLNRFLGDPTLTEAIKHSEYVLKCYGGLNIFPILESRMECGALKQPKLPNFIQLKKWQIL